MLTKLLTRKSHLVGNIYVDTQLKTIFRFFWLVCLTFFKTYKPNPDRTESARGKKGGGGRRMLPRPVDSGNCSLPVIPGIPVQGLGKNTTSLPEASGAARRERTSWDAERDTHSEALQCGRVKCLGCEKQVGVVKNVLISGSFA